MPKKTSVMTPAVPGTVWRRAGSTRRILEVNDIEVTYEQLTATKGPGELGETRVVGRNTFYNWIRLAEEVNHG